MAKRVVLLLIFTSLSVYVANAQLVSDLYKAYTPDNRTNFSSDTAIFSQFGILKPGKPVYNVSFGAGYTALGSGMGFSNTSVSPTMAFAPSEKIQVVVGATFSYMNFNNLPVSKSTPVNGSVQPNGGNPTQAFAYGQYQVNNRLNIYAMGSFGKNQPYLSPFYSGIGRADYQELGVGFNYKLGRRTTIGASFNIARGPGYMGVSQNSYNPFGSMFP